MLLKFRQFTAYRDSHWVVDILRDLEGGDYSRMAHLLVKVVRCIAVEVVHSFLAVVLRILHLHLLAKSLPGDMTEEPVNMIVEGIRLDAVLLHSLVGPGRTPCRSEKISGRVRE